MKYKEIKVSFKYNKSRLYRVLEVKEDISLLQLGFVIVNAFGGTFEHYFLFRDNKYNYVPRSFLEDFALDNDVPLVDYKMKDLPDKFEFDYDTGDGWDFIVEVKDKELIKEEPEDDDLYVAYILKGKGQGIWEDNIRTLYAYFDGELEDDKEDPENGFYFPWNFEIEKYSEFDNPINIEDIQDAISYCDMEADAELNDSESGY